VHGAHNRNGDTGESQPAAAPHCTRRIAPIDGAPICSHSFYREWTGRADRARAVMIAPLDARVFREQFGARIDGAGAISRPSFEA